MIQHRTFIYVKVTKYTLINIVKLLNLLNEIRTMEKTLIVINQMKKEGFFKKYAIGGGITVLFYIEPVVTFDLTVFIILPKNNMPLISLFSPLYEWLKSKGYKTIKEQILIEGIPVQFIPVYDNLVNEAVLNSAKETYESTETYVLKPEYLLVIMLQTNRPKDRNRIIKILDEAGISQRILKKILRKHNLQTAYSDFRRKYYESS
jgi:hypothetical protein